jgi:putative ABC transport system ATP-binding protein
MALIDVQALRKTYHDEGVDTPVLHGLNLRIESGEYVAIVGPSGSGKSTLLHILGLLDRATGGKYVFDGRDTSIMSDEELAALRNTAIGFIFQAFNLLPRTSALENVMLPLQYSRQPKSSWRAKAQQALAMVNMGHRLDYVPSQLSGGERQRVAIARALVNEPKVIFADEPTGNLDTKNGRAVMDVIERLHEQGHTIVLITHETAAAEQSQRIITIQDGAITSDQRGVHKVEFQK